MTALALTAAASETIDELSERAGPAAARRLMIGGAAIILVTFGFFGGWAALSPLDSAVVTYGVLGAEGNRKVVQHLDGGIVRAVLVKDGDLVAEGQELMRLDQLQVRASLDIQNAAVDSLFATIARLEAERGGRASIAFPPALLARAHEPAVAELIHTQTQLFNARRDATAAQVRTVSEQVEQARSQAIAYEGQVAALTEQYRLVQEELASKNALYEKGYATKTRILELQRGAAGLLGQKEEYSGNITRLKHTVAQLQSQITQNLSDQQLKAAQELDEARAKLADAKERQRAIQDVLDRTIIRAPATGAVLGLSVHTVGAVIGRGERLLEVVPSNGDLIVTARLRPVDGVDVTAGMETELRFISPQGRKLPMIRGTLRHRSADVRADAKTAEAYYEIEVALDARDLESAAPHMRLMPGTPVEVIVPTGSRTALEYLVDPVRDSFRHGLRER